METEATKRIAKNTIIMYIRMIILMCIGFFTSRLLLSALGVEDYGIYSVVGSIASTFAALKAIFSEAIQRFLNYQKGKKSLEGQRDVFTISLIIHFVLAVVLIIVLETVGLWLINYKLVIPVEKVDTALFVFQMTVMTSVLYVLTIPFEAVIIANERMSAFAYITILDGFYRLAVLLILPTLHYTLLKSYSLALVLTPLITLFILLLYCKRFEECKIVRSFNRFLFKDIFSLSFWNFFGNISFSLLHEGTNFVLNSFGGLAYNAARAVAYQVKGIAIQMSNNLVIAARPKIMQNAASNGNDTLFANIRELSRISFFVMLVTGMPVVTFCSSILDLWLVDVPEWSDIFTILVLLGLIIRSLHEPINIMFMSVAKIKRMMIIEAVIMLSAVALIYLSLSSGSQMWVAFAILAIMEIVIVLALLANAFFEIDFNIRLYLKDVLIPVSLIMAISISISLTMHKLLIPCTILSTIAYTCLSIICNLSIIVLFFNSFEKNLVNQFMLNVLHKKK